MNEYFSDDKYKYSTALMFAYINLCNPNTTKLKLNELDFNCLPVSPPPDDRWGVSIVMAGMVNPNKRIHARIIHMVGPFLLQESSESEQS